MCFALQQQPTQQIGASEKQTREGQIITLSTTPALLLYMQALASSFLLGSGFIEVNDWVEQPPP
jgi:hypothetical protein